VANRAHPRRRPRRKGGTTTDGERRQLARASRYAGAPPVAPAAAEWARLLCDGGSRGNPGPAAVAAVLLAADGEMLDARAALIGRATAAEAEYRAILLGLDLALGQGVDPIELRSDSRLAIEALTRETPVHAGLASIVDDIRDAASRFTVVRWRWHPRSANQEADALVRQLLWP
jgi:ribonuclease HI